MSDASEMSRRESSVYEKRSFEYEPNGSKSHYVWTRFESSMKMTQNLFRYVVLFVGRVALYRSSSLLILLTLILRNVMR